MKNKMVAAALIVTLCGFMLGLVWAPTSTAIDWWNWTDFRQSDLAYRYNSYLTQSDLMYRYNSYYTDQTKYNRYLNPWSAINRRDYPAVSDLAYRYSTYTRNLKSGTPPDLRGNLRDVLPPSWNLRYTLPPLTRSYDHIRWRAVSQRYSLPLASQDLKLHPTAPPSSMLDRGYGPLAASTDFKYLEMIHTVNQRRILLPVGYDFRYPHSRNLSVELKPTASAFLPPPLLMDMPNRSATSTRPSMIHLTTPVLTNRWFGAAFSTSTGYAAQWLTGRLLDPYSISVVSNQYILNYARYSPGVRERWTGVVRDLGAIISATSTFAPVLLDEYREAKTMNRPFGSSLDFYAKYGQAGIDVIFPIVGGAMGGFPGAMAGTFAAKTVGSSVAGLSRFIGSRLDRPYHVWEKGWWVPQSQFNEFEYGRWNSGNSERMIRRLETSGYHAGPSNFSSDIGLPRIDTRPIKPLDVSTLSPATQRLFADMFQRGAAARLQVSDYLSSLRTPALDRWLNNTSRMLDVSSLLPSSSFNSWKDSYFGLGGHWSPGYSLLGGAYHNYSSYSSRYWHNYNYGYNWRP